MIDKQYENYLAEIVLSGTMKTDRTGVGTKSIFGYQMRWDLDKGFPLVTTKRVPFKSVATELFWFLRGLSNVHWLQERGCTIWDEWAGEDGELGPVYGVQWRNWPTPDQYGYAGQGTPIDQIAKLQDTIRSNPDSRRMLVTAWNPADLQYMALEPCHVLFQVYVADNRLSLQVYQRSCDSFLGVPFNIASYALLTHLLARTCGYTPGDLIWTGGDCHIYKNHFDQVHTLLGREPRDMPHLYLKKIRQNIWDYEWGDLELRGYDPHPTIPAPVAV